MGINEIIILIIVGAVAGWLANIMMKRNSKHLIANIIIGVIGAFIGNFLFDIFNISIDGMIGSIAAALLGSLLLLVIIKKLK